MNKDKQNRITKFDELFERYYNAMLGAALRILKNERDAEDAVQQAGEALYKNIGKIPEVGDTFEADSLAVTVTETDAKPDIELDHLRAIDFISGIYFLCCVGVKNCVEVYSTS